MTSDTLTATRRAEEERDHGGQAGRMVRLDRFREREPHAPDARWSAPRRHTLGEDVYAFAIGASFLVLGVVMLQEAGLVTGGMAGIALLLSYLLPLPPTTLLLLVNLPFFWLAWRVMGRAFTVKTAIVNVLITGLGFFPGYVIGFERLNPAFAAVFGGTLIGMGILAFARHAAGVGGSGVVALSLQKTKGWNAGLVQLAGDCVILALSIPVVASVGDFALSVASVAAINGVLIVNHRSGRYLGY